MHIGVSCRRQVGFSIIELILVIALTFTLGLLIFPISISLLRSQTLEETTELLAGVLRRAELQAMYEKHDSAFGVKVLEGSYVLFEGGSYADRNADEDEVFSLASSVALGGLDEVVFLKRTGTPDTDGLITLGLGNQQNVIDVNYAGTITY
jgi:type II secretory pathway pseudopilin PulG